MRLRLLARALLGLGAFAVAGNGNGAAPSTLDAELAAIAADRARPLASLSVLAIRDGRVVYHRQFGSRWIDNADRRNDLPAGPATMYRIASISKLVTTLGVLRLLEQGRVALDADIGTYLGYPIRNPHFPEAPITLRMLLSHTSSLRDDGGYSWSAGVDIKEVLTPGGALHGKGEMWSPQAMPGAYFHYANLPWGIVGTIMEKVTGERFDRLMKRLVLDPLELQGGFNPAEMPLAKVCDIATLYRKRSTGSWIAQVDDYSVEAPANRATPGYVIGSNGTLFGPQGNLRASAADLGRIMRMLMDAGELDGQRFLARETVALMLSRQWRNDGGANGMTDYGASRNRFNAWGLGNQHFLDVSGTGRGDRLVDGGGWVGVGHVGDAYGFTGALVFDPATKNGMVVLSGGPGFDPEKTRGTYSGFYRYEERIFTALFRRAILGAVD
jgi:CubicO group peptidase (beta-lactamase class C family)